MAIVALFSKHKRNYMLIWIAVLVGFGIYCIYDGYYNQNFIDKHTNDDGSADSTLAFNQKTPYVLIPLGAILAAYLLMIKGRKVTAGDSELVINDKNKIPYEKIEQIDKTDFESKGRFTITYSGEGVKSTVTLSDRDYDNLGPVLDYLVEKIS